MDGKGEIGNSPAPLFLFFAPASRPIFSTTRAETLVTVTKIFARPTRKMVKQLLLLVRTKVKPFPFELQTRQSTPPPPPLLPLVDPTTNEHAFISSLTRHLGEIARDHGRARSKGRGKRERFASRLFACSRAKCNTTMPSET